MENVFFDIIFAQQMVLEDCMTFDRITFYRKTFDRKTIDRKDLIPKWRLTGMDKSPKFFQLSLKYENFSKGWIFKNIHTINPFLA